MYETDDSLAALPPAIDCNGIIIIVHPAKSKIFSLNSKGELQWKFLSDNMHDETPAIGIDGTIYVGSIFRRLYALGAN